jgi:ubiquinone/menaquinone biosynthesis C-methylase UbiE
MVFSRHGKRIEPVSTERRFQGAMAEDYPLIRRAIPGFDEVQSQVAGAVADHAPLRRSAPQRVLDLGCGDGLTSRAILSRCDGLFLTALDGEQGMIIQAEENLAPFIRQGRCQVVPSDALTFLRMLPDGALDVVASALAMHNLQHNERHALYQEILRVLGSSGLFAVADKFVRNEVQRWERLRLVMKRFFAVLVPLGKLDLLRECVLHEIADEAPDRLMREDETMQELVELGFCDVKIRARFEIGALLVAHSPA